MTSKFNVSFDLGLDKVVKDLGKMSADIAKSVRKVSVEGAKTFGDMAKESSKAIGGIARESSKTTSAVARDFSKMSTGISADFSKSMSRMSTDMVKMQGNLGKGISNLLSGFSGGNSGRSGGSSIGQGILQGVGQGLTGAIGSAMALPGEMIGKSLTDSMEFTAVNRKFDIVFGNLRGKAAEFSKEFSASINGSTTDTKAMMARFQDTLVPMGFSRRQSFEKSKTMTTLATDLSASEPGMTTGDAAQRLQSAMVGNHEAVRIFGISLSEASLKQELLNMKIKGGYAAATELEKATARLNIIMASSKDATGSAARASGDLRQQLGGFNAVFTETSARMGTVLAPALAEVVGFFKELGVEINRSLAPSETWGKTLAEGTKNVLATMGDVRTVVADVAAGFASFTGSMSNGLLKATSDWSTFSDSIGKVFDQAIVMLNPFILRIQDGFQRGMAGIAGGLMGVFGVAESSIKAVIDSILNSMASLSISIEAAIQTAGNLNQIANPAEMARQVGANSEHVANDNELRSRTRMATAKHKNRLINESDPEKKKKIQENVAMGFSIDYQAEIAGKGEAERAHGDRKDAINEKYGRDEFGHAARKNTSFSDAIKKAQLELKSPSTPGEGIADMMKKAWAGGNAGRDAYNAANPLGDRIAAADAAKVKAGEIKPKERGVIGWIDVLLTKGNAVSRSIQETASAIESKRAEQERIKGSLADEIAKAKDTSGGIDLKRDVRAYAQYLEKQVNRGVEYSSSEDLSKRMQAAFDDQDGAKLQLKAQQAIEKATRESNEKIKTLAKDMGSELKDLLGWGA